MGHTVLNGGRTVGRQAILCLEVVVQLASEAV